MVSLHTLDAMTHSIETLDYLVIVFYLLLTVVVGLYFVRFNKAGSDFFKGGNKIPWLVAGISAFMSGFSAWTFTGASGVAYNDGIIAIGLYVGNAASFILGYYLFAARWRRTRVSTTMEYLVERYDGVSRQTFSWATVFFELFTTAAALYGMAIFVSSITDLPLTTTIIVSSAIILAYCLLGGLWAVVVTDFLQGIILIPFTLLLAGAALVQIGGIGALIEGLPNELLTLSGHTERSSIPYLLSWTIMVSFGYNTRAHAQRYFSVPDESSARKIAVLNFVLFFIGAFIWFIPALAMRVMYPDIASIVDLPNPEEGAYALASLVLLPSGLIGIMLAAIFSASMSSISTFYNMHSAIISKDIIPSIFKREFSERAYLWIGRLSTLGIGSAVTAIAVIMAQMGTSVFEAMLRFNTIISLAYGIPALLGLVVKNTPHWSGLVTFIFASVMGILGWMIFEWGLVINVAATVSGSVAVFWLSGLMAKEKGPYRERRERFFKKLDTPIDVAAEVGEVNLSGSIVFIFLAKVSALIATLSLAFLITAEAGEHLLILINSTMTYALALLFYFLGKGLLKRSKA